MDDGITNTNRLRLSNLFLGTLTLIAVGTILHVAQSVILPLILAWLLSYIVGPVVNVLTRRKVPLGVSVALMLVVLLLVFYLTGVFLQGRVIAFIDGSEEYADRLDALFRASVLRFEKVAGPLVEYDWAARGMSMIRPLSGSLLSFMSKLLLVLFFLIFMLLGKPFFGYKLKKAFSADKAEQIDRVISGISRQIGGYLAIQLLISLLTGFLVWVALRIIGVDFAITWGALAFLLNFIPNFGSIIASIPPILLAIIQFYPSPWRAVFTLASLLSIQMVIGNFISPKIMGERLNLSPVVVLVSLVFWGWLWGVVGMLLSVPIASAIKIVCENIEPLRPISVLMGAGKPLRREFEGD